MSAMNVNDCPIMYYSVVRGRMEKTLSSSNDNRFESGSAKGG